MEAPWQIISLVQVPRQLSRRERLFCHLIFCQPFSTFPSSHHALQQVSCRHPRMAPRRLIKRSKLTKLITGLSMMGSTPSYSPAPCLYHRASQAQAANGPKFPLAAYFITKRRFSRKLYSGNDDIQLRRSLRRWTNFLWPYQIRGLYPASPYLRR